LVVGRQTPYKRIDLAVAACTELGLPLTVAGDGPEHQKLVKMAGPTIKFVTGASDADIVKFFQSAEGFIFPGTDDFGIVAVEALAAGTPVIAYKAGGALDYVTKDTGLLFTEPTAASLAAALQKFAPSAFDSKKIAAAATQFSTASFQANIKAIIIKETA